MNDLPVRIAQKIEVVDGCWVWTAHLNAYGYGEVTYERKHTLAHRMVWALLVGDPPPLLHHECHNRACVNPEHLVPVQSRAEHFAEHHPAGSKTHCRNGHSLADAHLVERKSGPKVGRIERQCRVCRAESEKRRIRRSE